MSRYLTRRDQSTIDGVLYFENPSDSDNTVVIFANEGGGLTIAVAEEFPMDSYNETFECTFALNETQAGKLRDYLEKKLGNRNIMVKPRGH